MILSPKAQQDFREHVLADYPNEACGLIVNGEYIKCNNVAEQPLYQFKIDPLMLIKHSGEIQAVLHSHPYKLGNKMKWDPVWPSSADMTNWLEDTIPWGIVATDGEGLSQMVWMDDSIWEPLVGREFVHGINDCYSLIRDYFRQEHQIVLPNYVRQIDWWDHGFDHYSKNFQEAGFVEIPRAEVQIGDCAMFQVRSPVINHAAVVTGDDQILHHLFHRLSGHDSIRKWERQIVKWVRYVGPGE